MSCATERDARRCIKSKIDPSHFHSYEHKRAGAPLYRLIKFVAAEGSIEGIDFHRSFFSHRALLLILSFVLHMHTDRFSHFQKLLSLVIQHRR